LQAEKQRRKEMKIKEDILIILFSDFFIVKIFAGNVVMKRSLQKYIIWF